MLELIKKLLVPKLTESQFYILIASSLIGTLIWGIVNYDVFGLNYSIILSGILIIVVFPPFWILLYFFTLILKNKHLTLGQAKGLVISYYVLLGVIAGYSIQYVVPTQASIISIINFSLILIMLTTSILRAILAFSVSRDSQEQGWFSDTNLANKLDPRQFTAIHFTATTMVVILVSYILSRSYDQTVVIISLCTSYTYLLVKIYQQVKNLRI